MVPPSKGTLGTLARRMRVAMQALGWTYSGGTAPEPVRLYFVRGSEKVCVTIEVVEEPRP